MAEAASIIQLIQFSAVVLAGAYEYCDKARRAPKEIKQVADEVSGLKTVLERLQTITQNPKDDRFIILKSLARSNGPFESCSLSLVELSKSLKSLSEASSTRKRLRWPLEARSIDKILESLNQQKSTFYLALAGDAAVHGDAIEDTLIDIKENFQELKTTEERNRIIDWLRAPDPTLKHNTAKDKRQSGTCEWLLTSQSFNSWLVDGNKLMWLHASPGAGKTILTSSVIERLYAQSSNTKLSVLYYYFDFSDASHQTHNGFLLSLISQICKQRGDIPPTVLQLYKSHSSTFPSSQDLLDTLIRLLEHEFRVFMVIDALDECLESEDQSERSQVLETLVAMKALALTNLSIFVASRPEADIAAALRGISEIDIDVRAAQVNQDIRCYVKACLKNETKMRRWPQNIKDDIEEELMKGANGMFRWAHCQLQQLKKCLKPASIRKELKNLPRTLDSTYDRILGSVPEMYEREMRMVLQLLTFSIRPITIQEVAEATAIDLDEKKFSTDSRFGDPFDLLEICSSLVSVTEIPPNRKEGQLWSEGLLEYHVDPSKVRVIQFAHFSVKEYLLAARIRPTIPQQFRITELSSHSQIVQACLIYILDIHGGDKIMQNNFEKSPFLPYAALHWPTHLIAAKSQDEDDIKALLVRLFDPNNQNHLLNVLNFYDPDPDNYFHQRSHIPRLAHGAAKRNPADFKPPLYYAAFFGLTQVVKYLLAGMKSDSLRQDIITTALGGATESGSLEIMDILLNEGADVKSALCGDLYAAASMTDNPAVVRKLAAAGAPIMERHCAAGKALSLAVGLGSEVMLEALIACGFMPSTFYRSCGYSLLGIAIENGHLGVVQCLLQHDAKFNDSPDGWESHLHKACKQENTDIVQLVLKRCPRVTEKALVYAASRNLVETSKILLNHGADVNAVVAIDGAESPLMASICSNNIELIELFIQCGADVNKPATDGVEFPLDLAINYCDLVTIERLLDLGAVGSPYGLVVAIRKKDTQKLVKTLLDQGVDPNAETESSSGSILQHAVQRGSEQAVRWLLDAGANPNPLPAGDGGSPLQAAVANGAESIVRLLLDRGAAVNPEWLAGDAGGPLRTAIVTKNETLFQLLLDCGGFYESPDRDYDPAFQLSASVGFLPGVKALLTKGVDLDDRNSTWGTALRAALAEGYENVARYLLGQGADYRTEQTYAHPTTIIRSIYAEFDSPLEIAAATNNQSLVQALLDHGLDINASSKACELALSRAMRMPDMSMLNFLVTNGADVKMNGHLALGVSCREQITQRVQKAERLLSLGVQVNHKTNADALSNCISAGDEELLEVLLGAGCDVNIFHDSYIGCALNAAVDNGNPRIVHKLLELGANVNLPAEHGNPFVRAISRGDEHLFYLFIEKGAEIDPDTPSGRLTPLEAAISNGYFAMATKLIELGADVHKSGYYGSLLTPAICKPGVGQLKFLEQLLELKVDLNAQDPCRENLRKHAHWSDASLTPLQAAIFVCREDLVSLLLDRGAHINPQPTQSTWCLPLAAAAYVGNPSLVQLLLDNGADINGVGGRFGTALQLAAKEAHNPVLELLLSAGADVSIEAGLHGSALQASAESGWPEQLKLLLNYNSPVNSSCGKWGSPLAAAAKRCVSSAVEILLAHKADVGQKGGKYGFPLQAACCWKQIYRQDHSLKIIQWLLDNGADVNAISGKYATAVQAAACHNWKFVELLLRHGADPTIRGGKYGSPYLAAITKRQFRAAKLLVDHGTLVEEFEDKEQSNRLLGRRLARS